MAEFDQHPSDEELISAYCDGELRGTELARAEELVANRPECRQLLEEYRALRSRLQDVPPRKLGDDFAQRVLRRAERDMLVTAGPAETVAYASSAPKRSWRWPQGRRPWVYAAAALAAAVLIMLVESNQRAPQIAQREPLPGHAELSAPRSSDSVGVEPHRKAASAPSAVASKEGHDQLLPDDMDVKQVLDQLGWPAISQQVARQAATIEHQQGGPMLPSDVLVVECSIAPQNQTPDPMVASFLNNSIAVDRRVAQAKEPAANALDRSAPALTGSDKNSGSEPAELFFVVATPDQLEATLAELGNRPGVSVKLLTENRRGLTPKATDRGGQGGETQRPNVDAEQEKSAATATNAKPGLNVEQSPVSTPSASQQGRAQRLDIPENLRRLVEAAPPAAKPNEPAERNKRGADQTQPPPAPAAEQSLLQRALFIVRVRAPKE